MDFVRSNEREIDAYCRQGLGALLAKLAKACRCSFDAGDAHQHAGPRRRQIEPKGALQARAVIVTVSTNVLAASKITFPDTPKRQLDALATLSLGHYERIALEIPDNPLGLARDDLVFEKTDGGRTAALLGNVWRQPLCLCRRWRARSAASSPAKASAR